MFDGYLSFGGIELINAERTTNYVNHLLPQMGLVRKTTMYDTIHVALEDEPYRTPFLDDADWVENDPDGYIQRNPTHRFFGLYPLEVQGIGDSTMAAEVVESVLDGGYVNAQRDATRSIRVHGVLLAADQLSVEYGLTWLRNALKSNGCGMHGDQCGYSDLRYFLAQPDVCDPRWTSDYREGNTAVPQGSLSPDTSPLVVTFGTEASMPIGTQWNFPLLDGVVIRWGALAFESGETLEEHGPVVLRRSNFIVNPRFSDAGIGLSPSLNGWTGSDAEVGFVQYADPTQWTRVAYADSPFIQTNWVPDPSFENGEPSEFGWRSPNIGGVTQVAITGGDSAHGAKASPDADNAATIEFTQLGPAIPDSEAPGLLLGTMIFSVAQAAGQLTALTYDNQGELIWSDNFPAGLLTSPWQRISLGVKIGAGYVVRLILDGTDDLIIDNVLLSNRNVDSNYFDGDTADTATVQNFYLDGTPSSASRQIDTTDFDFTPWSIRSSNMTVSAQGAVLSFDMAGVEGPANVAAQIVSADDDTVLGTLNLSAPPGGQRYAVGIGNGGNLYVKFTATDTAEFEIGRVMLEGGSTLRDYFDGNSAVPADYTLSWLAAPGNSISRMDWTGNTRIDRPANYRPFLSLDQGELPNVTIDEFRPAQIPVAPQLEAYDRTYHSVTCTANVSVIRNYDLDQGAAIEVDFILTAAVPQAFQTVPTELFFSTIESDSITDPPDPGPSDNPLIDPDLPALPTPPSPPAIPNIAITEQTEWLRYYLPIPAGNVALWASTVPIIEMLTKTDDVRQVRVRFFPNPFDWDPDAVDPTAYCGEFLLSYLPANSTLTVDGVTHSAYATVAGGAVQPANQLLYGTNGSPMVWPELSCGMPYLMTVDILPTADIDNLDLTLSISRRE